MHSKHPPCKAHPSGELMEDGRCFWCVSRDPNAEPVGFCGTGPLGEFLDSLSPGSRAFVERMAKIAEERFSRRR